MSASRLPAVRIRIVLLIALVIASIAGAACQSATTSVTGPSGSKCEISVKNNTSEVPASGGNGSISVETSRDCSWSAATDVSWITLSAKNGQGSATVTYAVVANPRGTPRSAGVVVAGQTIQVVQAAAECRFDLSPATVNLDSSGQQISVNVSAPEGCAWTARSNVAWVGQAAPAQGAGSASVQLTIAANGSADQRSGTVAIGNATLRITQSGASISSPAPPQAPPPGPTAPPSCTFMVSPTGVSVSAAGDQVRINVTADAGCSWVATSDAAWAAVLPGAAGSGSGSVTVTVSANTGSARTATLTVAGRSVTITQAAATPPTCTYHLTDTIRNITADPQELVVGLSAPAGCSWSATTDASWIAVTAGQNGSGDGSIRLSVALNTGGARSGTLHAATETLVVQQAAAACTYNIKPTWYDAGRGPDNITINVTADNWCTWTTSTTADWVTIDTGRSGTGNGIVRLVIPANTGPARSTTVTIAGNSFTLRQEAGCTASIKPTWYDAGRGPDNIQIAVTADPGCAWTAASTVSWVTVAEGSTGSGNGLVRLVVDANSGAPRAVTLTIAGQPFTLTQEGSQ
jgi:hypothetical protein